MRGRNVDGNNDLTWAKNTDVWGTSFTHLLCLLSFYVRRFRASTLNVSIVLTILDPEGEAKIGLSCKLCFKGKMLSVILLLTAMLAS